jgi:hypothetical protein
MRGTNQPESWNRKGSTRRIEFSAGSGAVQLWTGCLKLNSTKENQGGLRWNGKTFERSALTAIGSGSKTSTLGTPGTL